MTALIQSSIRSFGTAVKVRPLLVPTRRVASISLLISGCDAPETLTPDQSLHFPHGRTSAYIWTHVLLWENTISTGIEPGKSYPTFSAESDQASRFRWWRFWFLFGRFQVWISAGTPIILTEEFLDLLSPPKTNFGIGPQNKPRPHPSAFFPIHYSVSPNNSHNDTIIKLTKNRVGPELEGGIVNSTLISNKIMGYELEGQHSNPVWNS